VVDKGALILPEMFAGAIIRYNSTFTLDIPIEKKKIYR